MGILLYTHSVAFSEDLDIHFKEGETSNAFFTRAWAKYESAVCISKGCFLKDNSNFNLFFYFLF